MPGETFCDEKYGNYNRNLHGTIYLFKKAINPLAFLCFVVLPFLSSTIFFLVTASGSLTILAKGRVNGNSTIFFAWALLYQ